jgi:chromatin modification-related protein EAF6
VRENLASMSGLPLPPHSQSTPEALRAKEAKLQQDITGIEKKIHELETVYVGQSESTAFGTVLKGLEGFLTSKNAQIKNKGRTFRLDDRLFSLSSMSSHSSKEMQVQQEMEQAAQFEGRRPRATQK